jgi:hypothetical protein
MPEIGTKPNHYGPYNGTIIDDIRGLYPNPKDLPDEFDPLNLASYDFRSLQMIVLAVIAYKAQTDLPD